MQTCPLQNPDLLGFQVKTLRQSHPQFVRDAIAYIDCLGHLDDTTPLAAASWLVVTRYEMREVLRRHGQSVEMRRARDCAAGHSSLAAERAHVT